MKANLLLVGVYSLVLLISCEEPTKITDSTAPVDTLDLSKTQDIFTENKEFVYLANRFRKNGRFLSTDTILLTSSGTVWELDSIQKGIGWGTRTAGTKGGTGVIENAERVWIHPPRFDDYAILELSPFPEVKKPFVIGQEWGWELEVGEQWANPAWAAWKGGMLVKTHYQATKTQVVTTALGKLECQEVIAFSQCAQGKSTLRTLFHPVYGFILLDYTTIDGGRLTLKLIQAGISNAFDGETFYNQK